VPERLREAVLPPEQVDALVAQAGRLPEMTLATSHGDFQPGNVLILPQGDIKIIDWEYAELRWSEYDSLVYGSGLRFPRGLLDRLETFLETGWLLSAPLHGPRLTTYPEPWRRAAVAMLLLRIFAASSKSKPTSPTQQ